MRTFTIVNDQDGNDSFEVTAANASEAAEIALGELGYRVMVSGVDPDRSVGCYACGVTFDERDGVPADYMNNGDGGALCPECQEKYPQPEEY